MSLGRKKKARQQSLWIPQHKVARSPGHPFYKRLNAVLAKDGFDEWAEETCAPFFKEGGRPSIPPGVYFRMILVGYFEGLSSERGIAWRCADSLSLREFLGTGPDEATPEHSSLSVWRKRLPLDAYRALFLRVLEMVRAKGLLSGKMLGVDASTLEANAAMKSIVRKATGDSYLAYVGKLAEEAGVEAETPEEIQRFDKKRTGKRLSNEDWESKTDPEARIAKMKDGTTHLAYKAEHAVDLETSVLVAAEVHPADKGDTTTLPETITKVEAHLDHLDAREDLAWLVADKGYHKAALLKDLRQDHDLWTCIPETGTGKRYRKWNGEAELRQVFHENRRRCRSEFGRSLMRKRANLVERSFAHLLETGGMRRTHLRGLENVQKRYLLHAVAYNLGILMRHIHNLGTPRSPRGRKSLFLAIVTFICLYIWYRWLLVDLNRDR